MSGYMPKTARPAMGGYMPKSARAAPTPPPTAPSKGFWQEAADSGAAFGRGFGQGVTAGFGDELGAGLQSGLQGLANALPSGALDWAGIDNRHQQDAGDVYRQAREENRAQLREDQDEHGLAAGAGNLAGGLVLNALVPGSSLSGAAGVGRAALMGAASGLGDSEADLTRGDVGGALRDTAIGGALGAGAQYLGGKAGQAIARASRSLRGGLNEVAAEKALKAAGYIQKDLKPMIRRDPASVLRQGTVLLEEPGLITPGVNVDGIADRLTSRVESYGDQIGRARRAADTLGATFDFEPFLQRVEQNVLAPIADDPAVRNEASELRRLIDGYRDVAARRPVGFEEANAMKTRLQKTINFGNHFNTGGPGENAERFVKQLEHDFSTDLTRQLGHVLDDGSMASYNDAMARYGPLKDAMDKARQGIAREGGNGSFGIRDIMAGAAGSTFGPVGTLAAPVVSKVLRERGDSAIAVAARRAAQSSTLESLARLSPQAFGKWSGAVTSALARGPEALATMDKVLRDTDPDWRQMRGQQEQDARQ